MLKENGFYRGINLGGWFSQCDYSKERLDSFVTEPDFAKIAGWGMDHVRIPVDYNLFEDNNGGYLEEGFARLRQALDFCKKYDLRLMLDLHKTAGFSFDDYAEDEHGFFENEKYQERFYRLWEEFAKRFGNEPEWVAFELLNEVTDEAFLPAWKQIIPVCIERIRKYAPKTLILVGSYQNNAAMTVQYLDAPYDDRVIYNMHCYEPLKFTHQGAYWTPVIDPEVRIPFEESGCTEQYFEELFSTAIAKAAQYNTELYCGEYGVIDRVEPKAAIAWFRTIHAVFERHGIARCAWNYKAMDFGLERFTDAEREELLQYL
ncbi:MAG: cellulase family glycosylhydrolase [Oscillospiraceae bacterium]|nr:cellulase family glycosylhydrolase [Oscillospiraceae bacterium]